MKTIYQPTQQPLRLPSDHVCCSVHMLSEGYPTASKNSLSSSPSLYYELIWISKGKGNQWIDLQKTEINNNMILCLSPGQVYHLEPVGELAGYIIRLDEDFVRSIDRKIESLPLIELLHQFSNSNGIPIQTELKAVMHDLVSQIQKTVGSNKLSKIELLKCYVEIIIIHLNQQWDGVIEPRLKTRNIELVESFMSLLERNFKEVKMVAHYASQLAVTPNYLNEIVKKMTGNSAGHLIRQRVGLEAKRKALHSSMCMKEVAYSLGFSDQAHFSKFFKSTTGRNFSDFRKERLTLSFAGVAS